VARRGAVARLVGDLSVAEDCAQEACATALAQWPRDGVPDNAGGWLVAVARRRAIDHLRREAARVGKEREAVSSGLRASRMARSSLAMTSSRCCSPAATRRSNRQRASRKPCASCVV
jgi:predicted RNA polymerase sigma factor